MSSRWSRGSGSRQVAEVLRGRLLPVKDTVCIGGESDGEEDADPQFMDAMEIEGGGRTVYTSPPKKTTVIIKDDFQHEHRVTGFFPLVDPWWTVSVEVRRSGSQCFARGCPSYTLQDDMFGSKSVLSLFLHACNVEDSLKQEFLDWLPKRNPVTFTNLRNLAEGFKMANNGEKDIMPVIDNSARGCLAMNAMEIPLVLKYLPKLLPRHVKSLLMHRNDLHNSELPSHILHQIEALLYSEPWKLGFNFLVCMELNLCHCEARWENFLQCEELLEKIPELQKNALIIYNELKKMCMDLGDTYVQQIELTSKVSGDMFIQHAWEALEFLKDHHIVVFEGQRVFLRNLYQYEKDIALYISKLATRELRELDIDVRELFGSGKCRELNVQSKAIVKNDTGDSSYDTDPPYDNMEVLQISDGPCTTEKNKSTTLDEDQLVAAKMICSNPVTIISGKGGCGKTTVVSLVFRHLMKMETEEIEEACRALESDLDASAEWECGQMTSKSERIRAIRILLTAPTGKAASLLRKKTDLPAATLHQVTCSYSCWKKHASENPWKFSKVEVLVVDEGSLVSVHIFSSALRLLCDHAKLNKLIILGDIRQLPSIEPGNLLADIFTSLGTMKWAIELKTNHRAESQLIVDNATRISQQTYAEFDAVINIISDTDIEMPSEDKKFILVSLHDGSDHELDTAIKTLLKKGPGLEDDKHSQFIAFRRKDCNLINELCCKHYSGHSIKDHKDKLDFRCGDKVCCTRNAYVKDLITKTSTSEHVDELFCTVNTYTKENKAEKPSKTGTTEGNLPETHSAKDAKDDERLCNGEVFFIDDDVEINGIRELTLYDFEERKYILNYKALRSQCGLRHAWARTIHTFQGSEEDTVVYVLGPAGRQNWKHVYTAVTRGRKRVYIVAKNDQLDEAIAHKARDRKTRLQQRLKVEFSQRRADSRPVSSCNTTQTSETQLPYVAVTADQDFKGKCYVNGMTPQQTQSPVLMPQLITGEYVSRNDFVAHAIHLNNTVSNEHSNDHELQSSVQKRPGIPARDPETPSKLCRVETPADLMNSPLGCSKLQNLNINSPCNKKLFKP
ncbi:DNA helicase B [Rhinophrynus dorsalis]